jgi:hypothetical protein
MMKFFATRDEASAYMEILNRGDVRGIFCLMDGPEDNFA